MEFEERYNELRQEGLIDFVTFHPSYSYEEFVEGYRPKEDGGGFELRDGIFKEMCHRAKENPDKKFLLLIDEINRANISKVLGELIYAFEYRGKPVKLLYSQEDLIVPPNLYIIGTMNTADKSIALLDVALRRRFGFQEFMPDIKSFYKMVEGASNEDGSEPIARAEIETGLNGLKLPKLLETINERIVFLADREKQIGHSYFLSVFKDRNGKYLNNPDLWKANLQRVWYNEIIPLLQEYFYNDYGRIKLTVGGDFVKELKPPKAVPNSDYSDIKRYEIIKPGDFIETLIRIYRGETEEEATGEAVGSE